MYALVFLLLGPVASSSVLSSRQRGKVDPGTAPDCTAWDDVDSSRNWCQYFLDEWGLSREDFLSWNPGLSKDCTGFKPGNSYCVEVNFGLPRETTTKPTAKQTTTADPAVTDGELTVPPALTNTVSHTPAGPSPTQRGVASDCTEYYKAVQGDDCTKVATKYGISVEQFYAWNPPVGQDCQGLWAGYYYCVREPGSKTQTTPTPTGCTAAPTPTQPGSRCACKKWHKVVSGDLCYTLQEEYGFDLGDFLAWNPGVGASCQSMWLQYYVCVQV